MVWIDGYCRPDRERESSRDAQGDDESRTPWIWNPPSLTQTEGDRATPTRDFNNRRNSQDSSRSNSTPTRDYGSSNRRGSQDSHSTSTTTGTFARDYFYSHPSASRQGSVDSLGPRSQSMSQQSMSSTPPPSSAPNSRTSSIYSSRRSSSQAPPFPAPPSSSTSTATSSSIAHAQQPLHAPVFTREPESFTSRVDLQPTFSSNIVRTPTHYHQVTRRNTDETPIHSSRSPSAPQTSASGSSSRGPPVPEPLSRHHSLPNGSSMASLSTFTEDITSVLSPLIDSTSRSTATGSLSRSRTEPVIGQAHLTTIPETVSSSSTNSSAEAFFHPLPIPPDSDSDEDSSEPSPSPSRDRQRNRERERERERERDRNREQSQDYDRARRMTPFNTSLRSSNPLPPPPMERPNPAASVPPHQSPEPPHYARRVRKGLWNRRGDHLTSNLYVVYAPQDKAYPQELREYPEEAQGYKDQYGTFVPYLSERPELPASLPYHGRPPAQPYESVGVVRSY